MSEIKIPNFRGDDSFTFRGACGLIQVLSERDDAWKDSRLSWEGTTAVLHVPGTEEDLVELLEETYADRFEDPRWSWTEAATVSHQGNGRQDEYLAALRRFADLPGPLAWLRGTGTDQLLRMKAKKGTDPETRVSGTAFDGKAGGSGKSVFRTTRGCMLHVAQATDRRALIRDAFHCGEMKAKLHHLLWVSAQTTPSGYLGRSDENVPKTVQPFIMALAIESLALYPVNARGSNRQTAGFTVGETAFSWGLWKRPVGRTVLQRMLDHTDLHREEPDVERLRSLGFTFAFRSMRHRFFKEVALLPPETLLGNPFLAT